MAEQQPVDDFLSERALEEESERLKAKAELDLEIAKFKANAYDRASTATLTVGFITPVVSLLQETTPIDMISTTEIGLTLAGCCVVALFLHWFGRETLQKGLEQ
jgi:hypothetical protein